MTNEIIKIDTVDQYNQLYGLETRHPLVGVVDLMKATNKVNHISINTELYMLFLKQTKCGDLKYGKKQYDYQEGTVVSMAPGQVISIELKKDVRPSSIGLVFHPDLIRGTSLGQNIHQYSFFSYEVSEALHLSEEEKDILTDCLKKISWELEHAIDRHSRILIAKNIELLLDYCMRFYERQFNTRTKANKDVIVQFENLLNNYFLDQTPQSKGLPTVKYFADKICLSPNYFGDLIKKETGKTAQHHILFKLINLAKEQMLNSNQPISQIAYGLGFQYAQHFSRLFKKHAGCSPNEYRTQNNINS